MQNREGVENETITENLLYESNDSNYPFSENNFDSSNEYEGPQSSYQFRRWANHVWNVSNNVTNKLKELLRNNRGSNITTNNNSREEICQDENNHTNGVIDWTTSTTPGDTESSKRIDEGTYSRLHRYHRQRIKKNHHRNIIPAPENYHRYGHAFGHITEDHHRTQRVLANRIENGQFVVTPGVRTYPPVLILPRIHKEINRQPFYSGFHHLKRHHTLRCRHIHDGEYMDGWYQDCQHLGKRWGFEREVHGGERYSSPSDRHEIPEKLSSSVKEPKIQDSGKKYRRDCWMEEKIDPGEWNFKHFDKHIHHSEFGQRKKHGYDSVSVNRDGRRSRNEIIDKSKISKNYEARNARRKSSHSLKANARSKVKKVIWDVKLSDITSQDHSDENPSTAALITKSSKHSMTLNIENKNHVPFTVEHEVLESTARTFLDRGLISSFGPYGNLEIPVKDSGKKQEEITNPSVRDDNNALKNSETSQLNRAPHCVDVEVPKLLKSSENYSDRSGTTNADRFSKSWVTENSVDSLLQSLRERMESLANVHSVDIAGLKNITGSIESKRTKEERNLAKGCIVASCLADSYLPPCFENRQNKMTGLSAKTNEDLRPSFTDRIQDIWRDNKSNGWRVSPKLEPSSSSRYNLNFEKDLSSKLSILGLNQQPVLREYFGDYNNAVALAIILEKLIDSKLKNDSISAVTSEVPKPLPRTSRKYSKTNLLDVGVQKSTPMSSTSSQKPTATPRRGLYQKQTTRRNFLKIQKPLESPRPLQVFSGQSIIPISSIELNAQPLKEVPRLPVPTTFSSNCYNSPTVRHERSIVIDDPVVQETNIAPVMNTCSKTSTTESQPPLQSKRKDFLPTSIFSKHISPSYSRNSSFTIKGRRLTSRDIFYSPENSNDVAINQQSTRTQQEYLFTLVRDKIENERQHAQSPELKSDTGKKVTNYRPTPPLLRLRETRVSKNRSEPVPENISVKNRSWWPKKFHFNKSITLKEKITSFLKYVTKKRPSTACQSADYPFENVINEDVPVPPIRMKRKCLTNNQKSSKSIQWDLDEDVLYLTEKNNSSGVTENLQSNKITVQSPAVNRVAVTTGTNTIKKKSKKKSSLTKNKKSLDDPNSNRTILEQTHTDFPKFDTVANGKDKSESNSNRNKASCNNHNNNLSILPQENLESLNRHDQKEMKESSGSKNLKLSRSLSSKIPLAVKVINSLDSSSITSGRRPSTAPISKTLKSDSMKSNESLENIEPKKSISKDSASQEGPRKMLFKHNRSSLLRANNSILKKSPIRSNNFSKKLSGDKDVEWQSILKSLTTSSSTINEEESVKSFLEKETTSKNIISEKQSRENKSDSETKNLALTDPNMSNFSISPPTVSTLVYKTKQMANEKMSYMDFNDVSHSKTEDLTHDNVTKCPVSLPNSQSLNPKQTFNEVIRNLTRAGIGTPKSLKNYKARSPKPANERETALKNLKQKKLGDDQNVKSDFTPLKEQKAFHQTSPTLRNRKNNANSRKDEKPPKELNFNTDQSLELINNLPESKQMLKKISMNNSKISEPQSENKKSVLPSKTRDSLTFDLKIGENCTSNEKIKPQSRLVYSTVSKTAQYFLKRPSQTISRNKNKKNSSNEVKGKIHLESKSIPSSKLSPRNGNSKNTLQRARFLCKKIQPPSITAVRSNPVIGETRETVVELSGIVDNLLHGEIVQGESRFANCKNKTKCDRRLTKRCKMRSKNAEDISEVVREMLNAAINDSMQNQTFGKSVTSHSKKSLQFSIDSLDSVRTNSTLIEEKVFSRQEKEFGNSFNEEKVHCRKIPSPKKFSTSSKHTTTKICAALNKKCVKTDTEMNIEKVIPVKLYDKEYYLKQSTIAFDVAETLDKPEKLRSSIFNMQPETDVEIPKTEDTLKITKIETLLGPVENSTKMMTDDGQSLKINKGSRNVKIDNKVLEEKVKCSIENGVPLKTIIITDPSVIKVNTLHDSCPILDKNMHDKDLKNSRSEVDELSKRFSINSQDLSSDIKSEGQCSNSTWVSHKNRDIETRDKIVAERLPKTENVEAKEFLETIDKSTPPVDKNNSISNYDNLQLNERASKQRGTLIPRYKNPVMKKPKEIKTMNPSIEIFLTKQDNVQETLKNLADI